MDTGISRSLNINHEFSIILGSGVHKGLSLTLIYFQGMGLRTFDPVLSTEHAFTVPILGQSMSLQVSQSNLLYRLGVSHH